MQVCRWKCSNSGCRRSTFSDHDLSIAAPVTRRTSRVAQIASHMGHAAGGRSAERLLHRLGIGLSDDTVLRQLKRHARKSAPLSRVIGVDDWSWRKSQEYGTNIIDLECRSVVDILKDRDAVTCTAARPVEPFCPTRATSARMFTCKGHDWRIGSPAKRSSRPFMRLEIRGFLAAKSNGKPGSGAVAWQSGSRSRRRLTGAERH